MGNEDLTPYQIAMLKRDGELDERQARIYIAGLKIQAEAKWGKEKNYGWYTPRKLDEGGWTVLSFFEWIGKKLERKKHEERVYQKKPSKFKHIQFGEGYRSNKRRIGAWAGALVTSAIIILSPNLDYISKGFQEIGNYFSRSVQTEVYKPNVFPEPPRIPLNSPSEALATVEKPMIKEEENKYVVKKGDTLWEICTKRGYDYKQIAKANDIKITLKDGRDYALIRPGDKINLEEAPIQTPFKPLEEKVIPPKIKTNSNSLDKVVDDYIQQLSSRRQI